MKRLLVALMVLLAIAQVATAATVSWRRAIVNRDYQVRRGIASETLPVGTKVVLRRTDGSHEVTAVVQYHRPVYNGDFGTSAQVYRDLGHYEYGPILWRVVRKW